MGKGCRSIDDGAVESEPLTLVNGDGPRQFQRQLCESAFHLFAYLFAFLVQHISAVAPLLGHHFDDFALLCAHFHSFGGEACHFANHSVVVTMVRCVFHKHHLRPLFQFQMLGCGIGVFGKISFDGSFVGM